MPPGPGPYRIERLLGTGGMGQVFLAYDERLDRRVAIKHIRPESAEGSVSRARFRREAKAAARLSHSSIVQVFDIVEEEEGDWIVMELHEGPSVAELTAEGPLDVPTALSLGRQVAEGLVEAHDKGILHRDLKAENVVVAPGNRAKILDFGLAKPLWGPEVETALTVEGRVLGTCRCMSPEQARGLELDARSDLFSLGILLYEMVTGKSPFLAPTPLDTLSRICNHHPPPARVENPAVPEVLSTLIDRLLNKAPGGRPASAADVVKALASIAQHLSWASVSRGSSLSAEATLLEISPQSGSSRGALPTVGLPAARGRRWGLGAWALALTLGAALAGGGVWWLLQSSLAPAEIPEAIAVPFSVRRSVAVLGFRNLSGSPEAAWLSTGFSEMLTAELAAGQKLRTIAGENVARAKRDLSLEAGETLAPDTLHKLRSMLGVDLIVLGSYLVLPGDPAGQLRLVLNVQDTSAGETVLTLSDTSTQAGILELVSRVGRLVREQLGFREVPNSAAGQARASLPANPEALRWYSEGLEHLRAYEFTSARDLFDRAIEADPEHPLAYAALADAWSALGYDERARAAAARAVELSGELSRENRLFVEARDHEMSRRWDRAIESYRALYRFFPDSVDYGLRLANALTQAGQGREALSVVQSLRVLPAPASEDVRIDLAESEAAESLADYKRAVGAARAAVENGQAQGARLLIARARLAEAAALTWLGRRDEAAAAASSARGTYALVGDHGGEGMTLNLLGILAGLEGDFAGSRRIHEEMLDTMRQVGNRREIAKALHNIAYARIALGDLQEARPLIYQALRETEEIGDPRLGGAIRSTLSRLDTGSGDLGKARTEAEEALKASRDFQFVHAANAALLALGEVEMAAGNLAAARRWLQEGLDATSAAGDLHFSARFLFILGELELAAGEPLKAGGFHQRALEAWQQLGDRWLTLESQLAIARLALEEGHPEAALAPSREALALYRKGDVAVGEARASALLASALLALGRTDEMQVAARRAQVLLPECQSVAGRLEVSLRVAPVLAALDDPEGAATLLEAAREEAARLGFVPLELEARLHLAWLERQAGNEAQAAEALRQVGQEARQWQLLRLARKAAAAPPSSGHADLQPEGPDP